MSKAQFTLFGIGAALLVLLVMRMGSGAVLTQLLALGWSLALLVALGLVKTILRAWSWGEALAADGFRVGARPLLCARLASQALGYFSMLGGLADPLKPLLLRNTVPVASATPGTLVETAAFWLTSLLFIVAGTFAWILAAAWRPQALIKALAVAAVATLAVVALFQQAPLIPKLLAVTAKWKRCPARLARWLRAAEDLEERTLSFHRRHPQALRRIVLLNFAVQLLTVMEVPMVLGALGLRVPFLRWLAIEGATRVVKILSFYVPGRVGADEAGTAGAFLVFGLAPSAGLILAIARRVQTVVWVVVGSVWWGFWRCERPDQEAVCANPAVTPSP